MRKHLPATAPENTVRNFFRHVDKSGPNGCWIWKGCVHPSGYGSFVLLGFGNSAARNEHRKNGTVYTSSQKKTAMMPHTFSFWARHGRLPAKGMHLCHTCPGGGNKRCVNPDHLFEGTPQDNQQQRRLLEAEARVDTRSAERLYQEFYTRHLRATREFPCSAQSEPPAHAGLAPEHAAAVRADCEREQKRMNP